MNLKTLLKKWKNITKLEVIEIALFALIIFVMYMSLFLLF